MDDNSIRCLLTAEDLEENGLELEDFFHNNENARHFLQTVVERAREEVGYEFSGGALAMQLVPLPENELLITFSEKNDSFMKGISNFLKNILSAGEYSEDVEQSKDKDEMEEQDEDERHMKALEEMFRTALRRRLSEQAEKNAQEQKDSVKKKNISHDKQERSKVSLPESILCRFETMERFERFCAGADEFGLIRSEAYCLPDTGQWFLIVERADTEESLFRRFSARVVEYGTLIPSADMQLAYIREHGECIVKNNALELMKKTFDGD